MRRWLFLFYVVSFYMCLNTAWAQENGPNRVLSLDGDGDYVEMADSEALNSIGSQVTIEAWIRPTAFRGRWMPIVYKVDKWESGEGSYALFSGNAEGISLYSMSSDKKGAGLATDAGLVGLNKLNEVQRRRVRQEDVDFVAQELAGNPLPQMIYFWDGLESEQQSALSLLGEVLEDPNQYASAQTLLNFSREQNLNLELEISNVERVLDDLFVNEILERERAGEGQYEYRFKADLFRLWVRQAHSVWQRVA